jgi:hypothetical protein
VNGKIYVMGGSANFEYDPTTDSWVEKTPMPTPRTHFAIAVFQNKIYAIGAYGYSCANEVYDPATDTWETKAPMPTSRTLLSASAVGGKIHLFSREGYDVYDIATDSWTAGREMPYKILYPKAVVIDNKIYIISWNLTEIYDPKSDTWSLGATAPEIASNPGVCATTGVVALKRIYVFGGSAGAFTETNITQVYDPEKDTWTLGAPMPTARVGLDAVVVDDVIFAIGGGYGWGFIASANERYTPFGYGTPDPSYVVPDSTAPEATLISPENKTYYDTSVPLEFSVNESVSWMSYNVDDNFTEVSGNTSVTGLSFGSHNLTVYVRDDAGNIGFSETIHFKVEEPFPTTLVIASVVTAAVVTTGLFAYFKKRKR